MASSRILKTLNTLKTVGSLSVVGLAASNFGVLLYKYKNVQQLCFLQVIVKVFAY